MNIYVAKGPIEWFLKRWGYKGITIPPIGIFLRENDILSRPLIRHETQHWKQYMRLGLFRFYWRYFTDLARYGYHNHPMEIEARAAEWPKEK